MQKMSLRWAEAQSKVKGTDTKCHCEPRRGEAISLGLLRSLRSLAMTTLLPPFRRMRPTIY